jgi:two-component system sensor histidine kinase/response regulator
MSTESPGNLLIVDDSGTQLEALCSLLRDVGFTVTGASSPRSALEHLRMATFDVVLTDLIMPEMDGIGLLRAAQVVDSEIVFIVMTGNAALETAIEAMKAGALDYILKPFKLATLLPVLTRAITIRKLRRENSELHRRERLTLSQLEAANEELEAYGYTVSHDLRAPLRLIGGYADMLADDPDLSEQARTSVEAISNAARRMGQLIADLLEFAKCSQHALNKQAVDVAAVVAEVIQDLRAADPARPIEVTIGSLPVASADRALLKQVLMNLLSNAIKFSGQRAASKVEVDGYTRDVECVYEVRDNGVGFDPGDASRLFGVFQRLHEKGRFAGTGIGLSIVRRIIQRHGGRVWATSELGQGARFFFTLPGALAQ